MAGASAFIPGLNPQHPHYLPGYSGHCPLLRFSMGQTYGQATGQLLQGAPGLAWPPARRTLLPPIRPPSFPEAPTGSLSVRRGHERLSSSLVPGYTGACTGMIRYSQPSRRVNNDRSLLGLAPGFIPQARFIFAKNCSQAWAEALSDFNQSHRGQQGQGRLEEAKGEKDQEKDQEPKMEAEKDPEPRQKAEPASPYSMDDKDPQKFFMSGFTGYVPRARFLFGSGFPVLSNLALQEFGQMRAHGSGKGASRPPLHRLYPQSLGLVPHYGGYVPGYKFQFGRTYGHFTQNALGLSTVQKQLLA